MFLTYTKTIIIVYKKQYTYDYNKLHYNNNRCYQVVVDFRLDYNLKNLVHGFDLLPTPV